jgi:hypothetical protein
MRDSRVVSDSSNVFAVPRRVLVVCAVGVAAVIAPIVAYALGQRHPVARPEPASCLSMETQISCDLSDGWTVSVPVDALWGDGSMVHDGTRPACLPPTGIGSTKVTAWWIPVEVNGMRWREVLRIDC